MERIKTENQEKYLAVACEMPAAFECKFPECECQGYNVSKWPHIPISRNEFEKEIR